MKPSALRRILAVGLVALSACSGGAKSTSGDGGNAILTKVGYVVIDSIKLNKVANSFVDASFYSTLMVVNLPPNCNVKKIGDCSVVTCATVPPPDLAGAPPADMTTAPAIADMTVVPVPNAGDVSVAGGLVPVMLPVQADGTYKSFNDSTMPLFVGGETFAISAPGATLPMFSISLAAPTPITITSPTASMTSIPRSQDWILSWMPGIGTLTVNIVPKDDPSSLSCTFDVSAGSGTVPSAALMLLSAAIASVTTGVSTEASTTVGDWTIQGSASTVALDSNGGFFAPTLSLE